MHDAECWRTGILPESSWCRQGRLQERMLDLIGPDLPSTKTDLFKTVLALRIWPRCPKLGTAFWSLPCSAQHLLLVLLETGHQVQLVMSKTRLCRQSPQPTVSMLAGMQGWRHEDILRGSHPLRPSLRNRYMGTCYVGGSECWSGWNSSSNHRAAAPPFYGICAARRARRAARTATKQSKAPCWQWMLGAKSWASNCLKL